MSGILKSVAFALCLALTTAPALANDLYEARVPVSGQGDRERGAALRAAFEQVLIKVTGHRDALQAPGVESALGQPMSYVQQYFYQSLPDDETQAEALREAGHTQMLQASFDVTAVNRMLQDAGVPQWGRTRPRTLMWIAIEDRGERWLLGQETAGPENMRRDMERKAAGRGIALLFPLMDLEDRRQLHFTDVWGNFQGAVLVASARYRPGAVMVGRLWRGGDGEWAGRWSLYHEDHADHWSGVGDDLTEVIALGIDGIADQLAARHARVVTAEGYTVVDVTVTDIGGVAAYERTMAYLRGLDPVRHVQVAELEDNRIRFRVELDADSDHLVRLIGLGSALAPVDATQLRPQGQGNDRELTYRLLP